MLYIAAQIVGGILGAMTAHLMFALPLLDVSLKVRTGGAQWFAEVIAAFGLIATILGGLRFRQDARSLAGRTLYHGGLLVHGVHIIRESGRCDRAVADQHLFRHQATRFCRVLSPPSCAGP